jgi:hypothetical protein
MILILFLGSCSFRWPTEKLFNDGWAEQENTT